MRAHVRRSRGPLSSRCVASAALLLALPAVLNAQTRRQLADDDPQARLMGFYGAVMLMTPVGTPARGFSAGGDLAFIPRLSDEDRRVGFGGTKLENTNLCPVLPRLRAAVGLARGAVEVGLVPPAEVCGVQAFLVSGAWTRRFPLNDAFALGVRASALAGRVEAAITCSAEAVADAGDQTCFGGNVSADVVRPLSGTVDMMLLHGRAPHTGLSLYVLAGVRLERVRFDVNYTRTSPNPQNRPPLDDHERLEASLTRGHVAGGATMTFGRLGASAELFYAPGALLTMRGGLLLSLGGRP